MLHHLSSPYTLLFEEQSLSEPDSHWLVYPVSSGVCLFTHPRVSQCQGYRCMMPFAFKWILGRKLESSCWCSKHLIHPAVSSAPPPLFVERDYPTATGSPIHLDWPASKPQGSSCLFLAVLGLQAHSAVPRFFFFLQECWGLNSSPQAWMANTLLAEPSPRPLYSLWLLLTSSPLYPFVGLFTHQLTKTGLFSSDFVDGYHAQPCPSFCMDGCRPRSGIARSYGN